MLTARDALDPHLTPGERLAWSGGPDPRRVFSRSDAVLVPFSVFFLSFSVFWTVSVVLPSDGPAGAPRWLFLIVGIAFCAVGLYVFFGRFIVKAAVRRRTLYAVTDRRALSIRGGTVRSITLAGQPVVFESSRNGGHATVTIGSDRRALAWWQVPFGPQSGDSLEESGFPSQARRATVTFYDVTDWDALRVALDAGTAVPRGPFG